MRAARGCVVVEALARGAQGPARFGYTATKRIGGAVTRNRAKRRMRAAVQALAPACAEPGCDYVLIARDGAAAAPWPALLDDVRTALLRLRPALTASSLKLAPHGGPRRASPRRKDE